MNRHAAAVREALVGQFAKVWNTLREAIDCCPAEHWNAGPSPPRIPVRHAYHVLGGAEWCCKEDRFAETNDDYLLMRQDGPAAAGRNLIEQFLYVLRHCQHHVGEIRMELRSRGLHLPQWR